jgi:hypothetical protein
MRRWVTAAGATLACAFAPTAHADTASFSYTGAAQTFTVPAGVSSVHVVAVGAKGGVGEGTVSAGGAGGFGAVATADLAVSPGQILHVYVGGTGSEANGGTPSAGGFNGGGAGGSTPAGGTTGGGGAGGGASDVRSGSDLSSRLVVAAGGGGGGGGAGGGKGGDSGSAGANGPAPDGFCGSATGGGAGTASAGGAAGTPASSGSTVGPTAGSAGSGGAGGYNTGTSSQGGGGGGGGLFGGGGGGAGVGEYYCLGGGGGGGSSGFASAATNTSVATDGSGTPSVTFTYTPASGGGDTPPPPGGGDQTPPPAAAPDLVKPVISLLTLTPTKFIAANIGPTLAAKVGTRVVYELSEAATMTFTVERAAPGRRKGRTCVAPGKAKRGKKCTRYIRLQGSFTHSGAKGLNSFRFMGRLRGKALKRGNYRLVSTAADAARNRSAVRRKAFRILR